MIGNNVKVGLSVNPDKVPQRHRYLPEFDYAEIKVLPEYNIKGNRIPETNLEFYESIYNQVEAIHGGYLTHGVNFMNETREKQNRRAVEIALDAADRFDNCKYVVFHPGKIESGKEEYCCMGHLYDLMKDFPDKRIVLETIPLFGYEEYHVFPIHRMEDWKNFKKKTGKDILVDIGHSAITARIIGTDVEEYIVELINGLGVEYLHLSDNGGVGDNPFKDAHLSFGEGTIPYRAILGNLNGIKSATLEVRKLKPEDINFVRRNFSK